MENKTNTKKTKKPDSTIWTFDVCCTGCRNPFMNLDAHIAPGVPTDFMGPREFHSTCCSVVAIRMFLEYKDAMFVYQDI